MESNINISSCKYEEFTGLKLQGSNWELNLRLSKEDIQTLHKGIKEADWSERKSIKAGATCLSVPIYWNYEEKNNIVCIILGEDDECWDVGFVISFSDFETLKSLISCMIFIHSQDSIEVFTKESVQKYLA